MSDLVMFDAITVANIPRDAQAVAGYTDGNWPTFPELVRLFPHAHSLSITITAASDADTLDIENGDATPESAATWYARQRKRGADRPCLYANVSTMQADVVPVITAAHVARSQVRLWTAHYNGVAHICGPKSCGQLAVDADGTQWTNTALGRDLDQSLLLPDFFGVTTPPPSEEDDMPTVLNLSDGHAVCLPVPSGKTRCVLYADPGFDGQMAPEIRVGTAPPWNGGHTLKPEWGKPATAALPHGTTMVTIARLDKGATPVTVDFA